MGEIAGVCLLLAGVLLTLLADDQRGLPTPQSSNTKMFYASILLLGALPATLSYVLKEKVFHDFAQKSLLSRERQELSMAYVRALDRDFQLPGGGGPTALLPALGRS